MVTQNMSLTLKNRSILGKKGHTKKNESHPEIWVTLGKMHHICKNGSHLKSGSHWEKQGSYMERGNT